MRGVIGVLVLGAVLTFGRWLFPSTSQRDHRDLTAFAAGLAERRVKTNAISGLDPSDPWCWFGCVFAIEAALTFSAEGPRKEGQYFVLRLHQGQPMFKPNLAVKVVCGVEETAVRHVAETERPNRIALIAATLDETGHESRHIFKAPLIRLFCP